MKKETIILDHQKLVEILSNLFEEAVDKLDISECNSISNSVGYSYLVEILITKHKNHWSTVPITEKLNLTAHYEFREVTLRDVKKEILIISTGKVFASNSIVLVYKYLRKYVIAAALYFSKYGMIRC